MRFAALFAALTCSAAFAAMALVACVDGTTPDCSSVTSGCYPGDAGSSSDDASDAAKDAPSPSTDGAADAAAD